jgi:hypothetical protein
MMKGELSVIANEGDIMSTGVNSIFKLVLTSAVLFLATIGCAGTGAVVIEDEKGRVVIESEREDYYRHYPDNHYSIPPGHMPPPGKCRIWFPDLPPGQQPPPGDCEELRYHVPRGACLIGG